MLLLIPGKAFCIMFLNWLKQVVDILLQGEQARFRNGRSYTKQIFNLKNSAVHGIPDIPGDQFYWHQEKHLIVYITHHSGKLLIFMGSLTASSSSEPCMTIPNAASRWQLEPHHFQHMCATRLCLSPFLLLLVIDFVTRKLTGDWVHGTDLSGRHISDQYFADYIASMVNDHVSLQKMTSSLEENAAKVGLRISAEKTNIMTFGIWGQQTAINIVQNHVEDTDCFT